MSFLLPLYDSAEKRGFNRRARRARHILQAWEQRFWNHFFFAQDGENFLVVAGKTESFLSDDVFANVEAGFYRCLEQTFSQLVDEKIPIVLLEIIRRQLQQLHLVPLQRLQARQNGVFFGDQSFPP